MRNPVEIAEGVHWLELGAGPLASNVYFVRSGGDWVLVDAGWRWHGAAIVDAALGLLGEQTPTAMVLTHIHPDHSGAAPFLARRWGVRVYVHPEEVRFAPGVYLPEYANPLDRWVIAPALRLVPRRRLEAMQAADTLEAVVTGWRDTGELEMLDGGPWRAPGTRRATQRSGVPRTGC